MQAASAIPSQGDASIPHNWGYVSCRYNWDRICSNLLPFYICIFLKKIQLHRNLMATSSIFLDSAKVAEISAILLNMTSFFSLHAKPREGGGSFRVFICSLPLHGLFFTQRSNVDISTSSGHADHGLRHQPSRWPRKAGLHWPLGLQKYPF